MASVPSATEVRSFLEGYNITTSIISDAWINSEMTGFIIPWWENKTKMSLSAESEITEYYSGNGDELLILNRRPVNSLVALEFVLGPEFVGTIGLGSVELIGAEGIIKAKYGFADGSLIQKVWPKGKNNIKITYKYGSAGGTIAADVANALSKLGALVLLDQLEGRTGGGALSVQGFSRQYGNMGKYSNIRKRINQQAMAVMRKYSTAVVGA